IALLRKPLSRLGVISLIAELPSEGVSQAIVGIEQICDVEGVANRLACHAGGEHRHNGARVEVFRVQRERLEQPQHCAELVVDRSSPIVLEDEFSAAVTQRQLRDRGVGLSSKDALVETGDEGGERLPLAEGPRGWPAHHLLSQLGESLAEELFSIKKRSQ